MGLAKKCCPRSFKNCLIVLFGLIGVILLILLVIFPVVFKYSTNIQRNIIFPTWFAAQEDFSNIEKFNITGVRNFYVNVNEKDNVTLGIWQILPQQVLSEFITNDNYNYEGILANETYDILLYLHGNGGIRSLPLPLYGILRQYFHVLAPDYRGYGDSTKAELNEPNIISDLVSLYKWVKSKTKARVFVWGHSLGTGVSTHLIASLKKENVTNAAGLWLETPFTSVTDVMELHPFLRLLEFLPWFRACFIQPILDNGFGFESKKYILDVDCPIMILHAKDDSVIPYQLATKLYNTAVENRNSTYQGNVTYHLFGEKGYDHMFVYTAPELPSYIRSFIDECYEFEKSRNLPK